MSSSFLLHVVVKQAETPNQLDQIRDLFREYAASLPIDLDYQGFTTELAALPGAYAPPQGRLWLALVDDIAAGCVALRPLTATVCEMKRLYVRPQFRRYGIGWQLASRIVAEAATIGYELMRLDTLPSMQRAIQLYEALGFTRCAAYYPTPIAETVFMERRLGEQ
ncbi:GNAT family N-acetyltransferase [Chloroflexus sp.]|uniref:GNAT family N-acetyltransferase n=1 Tax=Chloroflexus sp. TaxID=1904827 RepID=UPI002631ECB0|nr:GNAT family N-acetyltransferase [uncultured Chloroflexus sp.]